MIKNIGYNIIFSYICIDKNISIMKIEIIQFKYFSYEESGDVEWNAKIVYKKYNKTYHCLLNVDSFHKDIYIPKNQPQECKVLSGIVEATKLYLKMI